MAGATASSTTPSRGCSGRTCGSTARRRDGINAALCGAWDCPVLLVTGDDAVCAESTALLGDGLTTVSVKQGLGLRSARMLVPSRARADRGGRWGKRPGPEGCLPYDPGKPAEIKVEYTSTDPPRSCASRPVSSLDARTLVSRATTGGRPGSSSSSRGISPSASQRRLQTTRGSSAALSRRGRRRRASAPAARPATSRIRGPEMLRREVVHTTPPRLRVRAPAHSRHASARVGCASSRRRRRRAGRTALPPAELVPVAMEDAHARVIGEEPARGRRAVLVELDRDEQRLDPSPTRSRPSRRRFPCRSRPAKRPRGRAAASARGAARPRGSTSARSASRSRAPLRGGLAAAQASAFLRGFSPEERRLPNLSDAISANVGRSARCRVGRRPRARPRACVRGGGPHLQDELRRSRTDRPCSACEPAACRDGGQLERDRVLHDVVRGTERDTQLVRASERSAKRARCGPRAGPRRSPR